MRYRIDGMVIRSENAARSVKQRSRHLVEWLRSQETVDEALDFGCGKLRYSGLLAKCCNRLTVVDSRVQVSRTQKIGDEMTTVRDYAADHWDNVRVLHIGQFQDDPTKYDLILCANVLSAIPIASIQEHVLRLLCSSLAPKGRCLFVTQYTNSYFSEARRAPDTIPHLDGYIKKSRHHYSYYGILPKDKLTKLVTSNGFSLEQAWTDGQSAFVLAGNCTLSGSD